MKMTSMKRTSAELKAEKERYNKPMAADAPSYDYGLRIRLGRESLAKLGLKPASLNVGDSLMVHAEVEVCEVSQNANAQHKNANVELQITKMCVEDCSAAGAVMRGIKDDE